jgi:hypothetical protein
METKRFSLKSLFNEEWAAYLNFLIRLITQIGAEKIHLTLLLPILEKSAARAAEAMEIIRKSDYTRLCDDADSKRDLLIGSSNNYVRAFLYEEDPAVSAAAQNLMTVIDHYAGMANENREQESNRIISFLNEMTVTRADQTAKIPGLAERLERLAEANQEYIRLQDTRISDTADRTSLRMVDVRHEGDKCIRAIWELMDVLLTSASTPDIEYFVTQMNLANQSEHSKLAMRKK